MGAGASKTKTQQVVSTTDDPTTTNGINLENKSEAYEEAIKPFDKNTEYFDSKYNPIGKYLRSDTSRLHDDYQVTTHIFEKGPTSGSIYKLKTEKAAPEAATAVGGRKRRNKTNKRTNKKKRNTKKRR